MQALTKECNQYPPEAVPDQDRTGLHLQELTLDDKASFDRLLADLKPETSDLTFTNLLMWQHSYGLTVYYDKTLDYWFIYAKPPRWKKFFLPPVGDWNDSRKLTAAWEWMAEFSRRQQFPFWMRRTPRSLAESFAAIIPGIELQEDRNTFDYLYRTTDLVQLAGRKFHGKKNHLNQFQRKYRWTYQAMTPEIAAQCLELETSWFNVKETAQHACSEEEQAMALVLTHFSQLQLTGGVIMIDDQIQALALGEQLNPLTGVIHIEKANTEIDGIYAAINQQFAANGMSDKEFINREEDMGIEGLRKAKLSYNPCRLIEKFNLSFQ